MSHQQHGVETLDLTAASQRGKQQHEAVLMELEAKKVAASMDVPTLPDQVRAALRQLGLPVRLFGENLADVRERLRMELARRQVTAEQLLSIKSEGMGAFGAQQTAVGVKEEEEEEVTKYTTASQALIDARQEIAVFSLQRAQKRLEGERRLRRQAMKRSKKRTLTAVTEDNDADDGDKKPEAESELTKLDAQCTKTYRTLRRVTLEGSQYGDSRSLSCLCSAKVGDGMPLVATGSWTGAFYLWDGSSPVLEKVGQQNLCHEDRIMGMDMISVDDQSTALIATASIDMTAKLWKARKRSDVVMADDEEEEEQDDNEAYKFTVEEQGHLTGHAARLCRVAFHPMKRHVGTTSFDHTWRLWDVETSQDILLQDGHWKECYGIGFHPDGSLCSTTDFAGVVQVWDLRTGKSIMHLTGHAKRVLNTEFAPNGFQLATAGDDGTIKVFDLRRRNKQLASLPAHSNLVTRLRFDASGEYLASSSFDGTAKLWSCRDWKMLKQLQGHEGKVSSVELLGNNTIVTCGFDKTLKLWR